MTTEQWECENQDTLMEYFIDGDPSVRRIQCEYCRKVIYTQTRNRKYCSFQTCGHKIMPPLCASGQNGRKQNKNRNRASRTTHSGKEKAYKDDRKNFATAPIQYSRKYRRLSRQRWSALLRKMSHPKGSVLCKGHCPDGQKQAPRRMQLPAH